jgi:hypothetical protein
VDEGVTYFSFQCEQVICCRTKGEKLLCRLEEKLLFSSIHRSRLLAIFSISLHVTHVRRRFVLVLFRDWISYCVVPLIREDFVCSCITVYHF